MEVAQFVITTMTNVIGTVCNVLIAKWTYEMYKLSRQTTSLR